MIASRHAALGALLVLIACGPAGDAPAGDAGPPALDTAYRPLERQPLTEGDLVGLDPAHLSLELPWTGNAVSRAPSPRQASGVVRAWETATHEGFDRLVITFDDIAPLAAYRIQLVDAPEEVRCADDADPVTLPADRSLVVRLEPARADADGGRPRIGARALGHARMQRGGLLCVGTDAMVWAAGLGEGAEVRVFEMRSPPRVVVDVR